MHLHIKKVYSRIKKTTKSNILFTTTNSRKTSTKTKSYVNSSFIVATIKIFFEDKIFIIVFIVDYNKNIETKYNFSN